jgi:hypothetical protein
MFLCHQIGLHQKEHHALIVSFYASFSFMLGKKSTLSQISFFYKFHLFWCPKQ